MTVVIGDVEMLDHLEEYLPFLRAMARAAQPRRSGFEVR